MRKALIYLVCALLLLAAVIACCSSRQDKRPSAASSSGTAGDLSRQEETSQSGNSGDGSDHSTPPPHRPDPGPDRSEPEPQKPQPDPARPEKPTVQVPMTDLIPAEELTPEPAPEPAPKPAPKPAREDAGAREAYAQALTTLLHEGRFPDGQLAEFDSQLHTMEENKFAICDVDGDGREELILKYNAADMAAQRGLILDYDQSTGTLRTQLDEFPAMTFFQNGAVSAQWSHNQGKGGVFWPYSIYEYRPESDSYSFVGSVEAWDANVDPEHYPRQIDVSNTGFVYYLTSGGGQPSEPVDDVQYRAWLDPIVGSGAQQEISFYPLTEDNIQRITHRVNGTPETPAAS